jgi:putative ABC transport system permease protein
MRIPLLQGRTFGDEDRKDAANVAVINRKAVSILFPGEDPLGKSLKTVEPTGKAAWFRVVGVVGDTRSYTYNSMDWKVRPEIYFPFQQAEAAQLSKQALEYGQIVVRTSNDPSASSLQLRKAIAHVEPNAAAEIRVMDGRVSTMLTQPKLRALIVGTFSILALLLVAMGLYGVMSQTVLQQAREIGTRMALGAQRSNILAMVLSRGLKIVLIGLGIGVALSMISIRFLASFLYNISAFDPIVLVSVCLLLMLIGLIATYLPARYASTLDPIKVLREE